MLETWTAASLFDALASLGSLGAGLIALGFGAAALAMAFGLQRRLVQLVTSAPVSEIPVPWWKLELRLSLPGLLWWPVELLVKGLIRLVRKLRLRFHKQTAPAPVPSPAESAPPLLVATLGPSFLLGGLATAGLYLVARLLEPLLWVRLALTPEVGAWPFVIFGSRPELAPYLPLDRHAYVAALLALAFWLAVAAWASRTVRVLLRGQLGRNLFSAREDDGVLPFWRRWAGASQLFQPDRSYSRWASWVVAASFPLLVWAWLSLTGSPWRVGPGELAVAIVLWLCWAAHLLLRGLERLPPAEETSSADSGSQANGWSEVLNFLGERLQVAEPFPFQAPREVEPLQLTTIPPETEGVISPLVLELLPEPRRLTVMQRMVLTDLALQGFVHVEPPVSRETLTLTGATEEVLQDRSGLRHRNQIVLAPEAAGKTTLALLAAANHVLVHTRSTLIIARDDEHETEIEESFRAAVEPSSVRWNVRVRRVGGDLINDLSQGIVPDVILCSLKNLTLHLLGRTESFAPFLQSLGLIIVDDVELFAGPVEIHAQLAFRRLTARVRQLVGVQELGEESAPLVLVLGADSMHDLGAWAKALCGIDAVVRDFTRSRADFEDREVAELAARGIAARPREDREAATDHLRKVQLGAHQVFYRLRDFRTAAGDTLSAADLVSACEQLAIPWCYRPCGDRRRRLGRLPLRLRDEPKHSVESPEDACVVFLEGRWSEVWRERQRLRRAGARFSRHRGAGAAAAMAPSGPEPIAVITLVDPDEDMAFTQLDRRFGLTEILEGLPQPVLRAPSGRIVQSHLAADLIQHWMEVAEVLGVFGHATAQTLRRLSRGGMLLVDRRTDVHPEAYEYVQKIYVRAMARATAPLTQTGAEGAPLLPSRVSQVELVAPRSLAIRDRTRPALPLAHVDAAAAGFLYYPGRIFTDARGSFVVVGRATEEAGEEGVPMEQDDILVEPILTDDVSSPRRRILCTLDLPAETLSRVEGHPVPPEPVLFGRHPLRVGLVPVEVRVHHVATYRLGPVSCEIRQRLLRGDERADATSLVTWGLLLSPNPPWSATGEAPRPLRFGEARLIAAALRTILPSMYRGAADNLEVALLVEGRPGPEDELAPDAGFLLFDLEEGGNGTAQAIHRDGLETLLRLCRLLVERVLSPDRLLALHDHWGDRDEILASDPLAGKSGEQAEVAWQQAQSLRQGALIWLDEHLRPEGRTEAGDGPASLGSGSQEGEGDVIDIGRCWASPDGAVTDLVWAKHRWRLPAGNEAMLDVGFDRTALADARLFTENTELLAAFGQWHASWQENPDLRLSDGTVWGGPRAAWLLSRDGESAEAATGGLGEGPVAIYHAMAEAIAAHGWPLLEPLATTLLDRSESTAGDVTGRLELARYLSRFVQGIPYSIPDAVSGGLRPPVSLLLYRLGDCDSKSLLLALLAAHCGIDAGLFVSFPDRHAMAALALPDPIAATAAGASEKRLVPTQLAEWSALAGLPRPPRLWAEMPTSLEAGAPARVYVPVESTVYSPVGRAQVEQPGTWAFLPLTTMRSGIPSDGSRSVRRADRVELESR
jgi:hypothetical protein